MEEAKSTETNWKILDGSLHNSISVDSPLSPITADDFSESISNSPLLLTPQSSDSDPCDITISFTQKHEIRQVYIRSTARVYEIYYASSTQSNNEYLCTVRCSRASKEESVSTHSKDSTEHREPQNSKNGSSTSSSEDEWVEVKPPDSAVLKPMDINTRGHTMDFYEATAEITDAEPCTSLILRLLSLQDKEQACIDEVYVYATPVEPEDSEEKVDPTKNSAGTSLMSMLFPTILQLSKTTPSRIQETHTHNPGKQINLDIYSKQPESINVRNSLLEGSGAKEYDFPYSRLEKSMDQLVSRVGRIEDSISVTNRLLESSEAKENDLQYSRLEKSMDQLTSRVGRIEDLFSRFEENMLKPISTMETRLQRVEQKLDLLTKESQSSEFSSCMKFSAPELPSNESTFDSSDRLSIPPNDMSVLLNATQFVPKLGKEENEATDSATECLKYKRKQGFSNNNALASALAGFLSTSQKSKDIPSLSYSAEVEVYGPPSSLHMEQMVLNFLNDPHEEAAKEVIGSSSSKCIGILSRVPEFLESDDDGEGVVSPKVSPSTISLLEYETMMEYLNDDHFAETGFRVEEEKKLFAEENPEHDVWKTDNQIIEDTNEEDASDSVSDEIDISTLKVPGFSAVDFRTSILDVRFNPHENFNSKSPLEALLNEMPGSTIKPREEEEKESVDDAGGDEEIDLILEENRESSLSDNLKPFWICYDLGIKEAPISVAGEPLKDLNASSNSEISASLI